MRGRARGITLLELLLATVLMLVVLTTLTSGYLFIYGRMLANIRLQNIHLQMDYALENIRLHALSASRIDNDSIFPVDSDEPKYNFSFEGESDIHNITPENNLDNAHYTYRVTGEEKNLVLEIGDPPEQQEVLVEAQYAPAITFEHRRDTEPNFMTVTINATAPEGNISKTEGLRFWFTDVVKPR